MAPKKDDLGIELDEDVERALADPKSSVLSKVIDYFLARKRREAEIVEEERKKSEKKTGVFGGFLD